MQQTGLLQVMPFPVAFRIGAICKRALRDVQAMYPHLISIV